MSTVEQQLLYWVLNSLSGGELPVKTTVDGSEYLVVVNPNTERVERIKNNINDSTKLWSEYIGDFTDDSGILKLGKLDDNLTIEINSVDDEIKLKGLTEVQEARILEDLEVFGDFSTDESVRIKSNNGSLTIQYTENGDFVQELQNKDGIVALLSDIPNLDDFVTLDTGQVVTGNKNFTGQLTGLNITGDTVRVQTIVSKNTGLGAVNLNTIQAIGSSPSFIILDENNNNTVDITLNNTVGDVNLKTPNKDGTLLVDSDLNNTVTFNNQNAIVVNNPDAAAMSSPTKGSILFTDEAGGVFTDFEILKEDFVDNFVSKGSRLIIRGDLAGVETDFLTIEQGVVVANAAFESLSVRSQEIISQGTLEISNADGQIKLKDTTSGFNTKINTNLIDKDTVLQVPNESGEIALKKTGWAQYGDTQYTSANPLVITQGNTGIISLDGLTGTVKTQLPNGSTDLYDVATSKITPIKSGDGYSLSLGFNASTNNNSGDFDIFLDIGGSFTKFKAENKTFPKGSGAVRPFMYNISAFYSGDTFIANGGSIKITSNTGSTSLFDFDLQIHKTHDAN